MNAGVLIVAAKAGGGDLTTGIVGFVFNVMLIVRAPLQLFQAIQTSILPHLAGLEAREGAAEFHKAIRTTVLVIAAFGLAVALGLLLIGPAVMTALLGDKGGFTYGRVGLAVVGPRDGPAPHLRHAQPGRPRPRPGGRRRRSRGWCRPRCSSSSWPPGAAPAGPRSRAWRSATSAPPRSSARCCGCCTGAARPRRPRRPRRPASASRGGARRGLSRRVTARSARPLQRARGDPDPLVGRGRVALSRTRPSR